MLYRLGGGAMLLLGCVLAVNVVRSIPSVVGRFSNLGFDEILSVVFWFVLAFVAYEVIGTGWDRLAHGRPSEPGPDAGSPRS
ncbi:MAG: hypothetical protein WKF80_04780 [Thermomicrobiales bacterium]